MPNQTQSKNFKHLARLDIPGGGQVTVGNGYAFVGHMNAPHGTSIIDVRDPRRPKLVHTIMLPDDLSHTHKVRVIGDLMFVNVEQAARHQTRQAGTAIEADPNATDAEIAVRTGLPAKIVASARFYTSRPYDLGGCKIYDISDKARPREIAYIRTHGFGAHRFDVDERYLYLSTEMEGYIGNILVIYDLADPSRPKEVSRWWMPGQHVAGGETPSWQGYGHRLHHALRSGNRLWAACMKAGVYVIDCSDITRPRTLGSYNYHPPFPSPTHTVMPIRARHNGRQVAVAVDEEHDFAPGEPHAGLWFLDVEDPADIRPISVFHLQERASPHALSGLTFGAHQYNETMHSDTLFVTWFSGGLRAVDTSKPAHPRETGHFLPQPPDGYPAPMSNDVCADASGIVYLCDRNRGLDILQFEGG
ncbi:LVIVD repeat-containing protein [Chelativorans alearense]|uniref:LVIVD repeat-containing protein n=1 Tax=Chelativorans alearense TaxID=2681495 RepID=UPI0013D7A3DB|nr:RNA polymerase subunit sigma-70 [Chelativorans alearense]